MRAASDMTNDELCHEYGACHWAEAQAGMTPELRERFREIEAEIDRRGPEYERWAEAQDESTALAQGQTGDGLAGEGERG